MNSQRLTILVIVTHKYQINVQPLRLFFSTNPPMFFSVSPPGKFLSSWDGMGVAKPASASWIVLFIKIQLESLVLHLHPLFSLVEKFSQLRSSPTPGHKKKKLHKMIGGRIAGAVLGVVVVETAWL